MNGIIAPPGFVTHVAGDDEIVINQTGTYLITYEVFPQQGTSAFALFNGASQIPGSNYGSRSGNETYSGQIITVLTAGDIITLRNIDGATTLNNTVSGSGPLVVSASIVIEQLA
ncbi:hypothetical protein ACFVSS_19160 [Peribacillus butanolivorans]|uniref:BclA C-terminal domain-containing protein n=1 Tax=Peribacillus butanolivorans TaxID=421767 RepID=UPI0036DDDDBA